MYICNAFSLQMLPSTGGNVTVSPITKEGVRALKLVSAIGHADTSAVVSDLLDIALPANRVSLKLQPGDAVIVAQIQGGRLPEGATTLPSGIVIKFFKVDIN